MTRRLARASFTVVFIAVACAWLMSGSRASVLAAGNGPTIALGAATGLDVPVNATTSPDAYNGFHVHVTAAISAGVSLTAVSGSGTGGFLAAGGQYCTSDVPAFNQLDYGCVATGGQSTTVAGLLATMTLHATGNGCIRVRLVNLPDTDPDATVSDTYTVDAATLNPQLNTVSSAATDVILGSGVPGDCTGLGSVGGVALEPGNITPSAPSQGSARVRALLALAAAVPLASVALGVILRRRSAR